MTSSMQDLLQDNVLIFHNESEKTCLWHPVLDTGVCLSEFQTAPLKAADLAFNSLLESIGGEEGSWEFW
jgi:hypothetical protein